MNSTDIASDRIKDYYITCSVSALFFLIAAVISLVILIVVWKTKPRLHTVRHLLTCNTAVASIVFCIVQTNNYAFLVFIPQGTSDMSCRWRGYFSYVTLSGVAYSFLIQAISRLFISIFSRQYRWLTTFKMHFILISIQWLLAIIVPLPAIVTEDIVSRPYTFCYVPLRRIIHVIYTYLMYYIIPAIFICFMYIFIYYRVKQSTNRVQAHVRANISNKRDLILLRNTVILVVIYLMGGFPSLLFLLTSVRVFYFIGLVSISFGMAIEKVFTIVLDQELRQVMKSVLLKKTLVVPFDNQGMNTAIPRTLVQAIHRMT